MTDKDAALELAKECGGFAPSGVFPKAVAFYPDKLTAYYNAARKPLEEHNARLSARAFKAEAEYGTILNHCRTLEQQLLATQEAYQRVVEALKESTEQIKAYDDCVGAGWVNILVQDNEQALANPPSLEAVERKKLEDEIVVLEYAKFSLDIGDIIAERKAKLEKMK